MTFSEAVRDLARKRGLRLADPKHSEPLADLAYADELLLKNDGLRRFWRDAGLPAQPQPVVAAPRPRGYRTTSKRRAVLGRGGLALAFSADVRPRRGLAASQLDPPEHLAVYSFLLDALMRPASTPLTARLNYVIVRGSADAITVILNLRAFDSAIVRRAKQVGDSLAAECGGVRSAFLYLDPTGSDYYLEARRPAHVLSFKRLFGPDWIEVCVDGLRFRFPPFVFSQVNGDMLPVMTATARELLQPLAGHQMLDLFCGYGLFSLSLGRGASQVLGVDAEGPAIQAARGNAFHAGMHRKARFLAGRITGDFIESRVRSHPDTPEVVLLDPPRQGTASGVVEVLARRRPQRVLHVFCGTDQMPGELARWRRAGFHADRIVPLDLFPGSINLETLVRLRPSGSRAQID